MSAPYAECDLDAIVIGVTVPRIADAFVQMFCDALNLPAARGGLPQSAGSLAPRDGTEATARGAT